MFISCLVFASQVGTNKECMCTNELRGECPKTSVRRLVWGGTLSKAGTATLLLQHRSEETNSEWIKTSECGCSVLQHVHKPAPNVTGRGNESRLPFLSHISTSDTFNMNSPVCATAHLILDSHPIMVRRKEGAPLIIMGGEAFDPSLSLFFWQMLQFIKWEEDWCMLNTEHSRRSHWTQPVVRLDLWLRKCFVRVYVCF